MKRLSVILVFLTAGAALAHQGVKNPAVQARMHGMKEMGAATKVLGDMVKGTTSFDSTLAADALEKIRTEAMRVDDLFEAQEDDPKSEALPLIWDSLADFQAKSDALIQAASGQVNSLDDVKATMAEIGAACTACHKAYRE